MISIQEFNDNDKHYLNVFNLIKREFSYLNLNKEKFEKHLNDEKIKIFKALFNERFSGFIDLKLDKEKGIILGIAVLKKFRGKNIARELIQFALTYFKSCSLSVINLLVARDNVIAKKLYRSFGFKKKLIGLEIAGKKVELFELNLNTYNLNYIR